MGLEYLILEDGLGAPGVPVDESSIRGAIEPFGVLFEIRMPERMTLNGEIWRGSQIR
jgi:hypothetical protein